MNGQESEDKKANPATVQKPKEEMDQTDRAQAEMAERLAKEGPKEYPPDFVDYGEARQRIDRDEVWVN